MSKYDSIKFKNSDQLNIYAIDNQYSKRFYPEFELLYSKN